MTINTENKKKALEELEGLISEAMTRVSAQKETDLCQYIPSSSGRLHHFAFGKLKKTSPGELGKMVKEHIIEVNNPVKVGSTPRVRVTGKRVVGVQLNRSQINQLLNVLKSSNSVIQGADELIAVLSPHQTFKQVQKLMLDMVREKKADVQLWETYVKLLNEHRAEE